MVNIVIKQYQGIFIYVHFQKMVINL
jgi:hypothetical protein